MSIDQDASEKGTQEIYSPSAGGANIHRAVTDAKLQGINKRLIFINMWSLTGALNYGYMAACIGSTLGQPSFYADNPDIDPTTLRGQNLIGTIVGMQSIGGALGVILVCFIQDRFGRKAGFAFGALLSLLGAALAAGTRHYVMLIFGRLFSGMGCWSSVLSAVAYQSETAPATRRGYLGGSIGPSITFGYTIAAWLSVAFYYVKDSNSYRWPLVIQIFFPLLTLAGLPFVPESPRWLLFNDRSEQAMAVLEDLHYARADPGHAVARAEHYHITMQSAIDRQLPSSWRSMFTIYRKRSLTIIFLLVSVQVSGSQMVTNYGPTLYQTLGLSASSSLMVAGGWYITAWASDTFFSLLLEKVGRRPLIVWGQLWIATSLAIMIALIAKYTPPSADATNKAGQRAAVFSFFWFVWSYGVSEPAYYVYMAEIFPTHIRVKGIAIALVSLNMTAFWVTLSQPAGTLNSGWKYYLVFLVCTLVTFVGLFFVIKETKGLALEEIALIFGDEKHVATEAAYRHALETGEADVTYKGEQSKPAVEEKKDTEVTH